MAKTISEENDVIFRKCNQFVKSCNKQLENIQNVENNVALVSYKLCIRFCSVAPSLVRLQCLYLST